MLEGMYSAAAGMAAQQQRIDAVANDLANVNTAGYKPVRVAFRDLVYNVAERGAERGTQIGTGAALTMIGRSGLQGAMQATGRPLDVMLDGQGFFTVRTADGDTALTRDGQLRLDNQGRLGLQGGELLDPPIRVPAGTDENDITVASDGAISVRGQRLGALRLVTVAAPGELEGLDGNLFRPTAASGQPIAAAASTRVLQNALEASGVDVADAMTDLTISQRAYQLASKALQTQDQMMEIANGVKR